MGKMLGSFGDEVHLRIKQGKTFEVSGSVTNPDGTAVDLTGCTLRAQIRTVPYTSGSLQATFDVDVVDAAGGTFSMVLTRAVTRAFTFTKARWDLEYVDATDRELPVCGGEVFVEPEVTFD